MSINIKRGDIFWCNLDPTVGAEIQKIRPCVVISNNAANEYSPLITVLPIKSQKLNKQYRHEVELNGVKGLKKSKVKVQQIRTLDKQRVGKKITSLSSELMDKVNFAVALHLGLMDEL